jgi:hypothetical protein
VLIQKLSEHYEAAMSQKSKTKGAPNADLQHEIELVGIATTEDKTQRS